MSFWSAIENKKSNFDKVKFVQANQVVELVDKEKDLRGDSFVNARLLGNFVGFRILTVPLLKDGKFLRKGNHLVGYPKASLGYNYLSGELDESKCPYLQMINASNTTIVNAVISFITDPASTMKDKDELANYIRHYGLSAAWEDKQMKALLEGSKELVALLKPIMTRGHEEYYTNIVLDPMQAEKNPSYYDMSSRTAYEATLRDFPLYTETYGKQVYFKESKASAAPTPVKVLKVTSSHLRTIFKDVVKENLITNSEGNDEVRNIEDPTVGSYIKIRLETLANLKQANGNPTTTYKFALGTIPRKPLTENESKYLLWDLSKISGNETYEEAVGLLARLGYSPKRPVSTVSFSPEAFGLPVVNSGVNAGTKVTSEGQPASINKTLSQGNVPVVNTTPVEPRAQTQPVSQLSADNFDEIFGG
jgi:hypothetical protein